MLTAYMGNVREKGFLRYFELTPSRYRAQLACLDVRTRAPDVAIRPAKQRPRVQERAAEFQREEQGASRGRRSAERVLVNRVEAQEQKREEAEESVESSRRVAKHVVHELSPVIWGRIGCD